MVGGTRTPVVAGFCTNSLFPQCFIAVGICLAFAHIVRPGVLQEAGACGSLRSEPVFYLRACSEYFVMAGAGVERRE